MKRYVLALLLCLFIAIVGHSQNVQTIHGKIYDYKTHTELAGATVQLLSLDSIEIAKTSAYKYTYDTDVNGDKIREYFHSDYSFDIPRISMSYILKVSHVGYDTKYVRLDVTETKKSIVKEISPVYLKASALALKEVNVTASMVKFYHKGDTVVYNAAAFVLSEGSMLDALIKQLPGVELKEDGRIFHNGRFVESLMLNGKDFFKGNSKVMLENLPSYAVKHVKLYDKKDDVSTFLGQKVGNKKYVMDVSLKKEYSINWLGNIEAGLGTSDRYLTKMFFMRNTDHSRFTVLGNLNNLNDIRRPGQNTTFSPANMPKGENKEQMLGLDYNINSRNQKVQMYGNAILTYQHQNLAQDVNRVNFIHTGDTYDYDYFNDKDKKLTLTVYNNLIWKLSSKWQLYLTPTFEYVKYNMRNDYLQGSFTSSLSEMKFQVLENIFKNMKNSELRKFLISLYKKESLTRGHEFSGIFSGFAIYKLDNANSFSIGLGGNDVKKKEELFNRYGIKINDENVGVKQGSQYFKNWPSDLNSYWGSVGYSYLPNQNLTLSMSYRFDHMQKKNNSDLYLLDQLDKFNEWEIGKLPSVAEYENTLDFTNSYWSKKQENKHAVTPELVFARNTSKGNWFVQFRFPVSFLHQKLYYNRGRIDTMIIHNASKIEAENCFVQWRNKDNTWNAFWQLETRVNTPELSLLVNMCDAVDPMNVKLGAAELKNEKSFYTSAKISRNNWQKKIMQTLYVTYSYKKDALAMGRCYNLMTGVRTYIPYNVNGNWEGSVSYSHNRPLDFKKLLTLSSTTSLGYVQNVDMQGSSKTESIDMQKNKVHTALVNEDLKLDYKIGRNSAISIKSDVAWRNITSGDCNFDRINAVDFKYGTLATISLFKNFQLSTDLFMFSRRGYKGSSLNTDELLLNARLSYTMLKGKLTWLLDGFDILGNLNNVTRVVNAQGRTETYSNVLPRYILFHAAYNFSISNKKK